ncbi:unnamed protein product [Lepidochelys olivacea]
MSPRSCCRTEPLAEFNPEPDRSGPGSGGPGWRRFAAPSWDSPRNKRTELGCAASPGARGPSRAARPAVSAGGPAAFLRRAVIPPRSQAPPHRFAVWMAAGPWLPPSMEPDLLPLVLTAEPWGFNQQATELGPGAPGLEPCSLELERRYQAVPAAVCALCCLFGVIYSCFGYRCFKAIMFLSGLLFGSLVIFLLCYKERVLETQLSLEVSAGIALGIGALCGLVTMLVHSVGLFMTGLLLGLLLATAALVVTEPLYQPQSLWVPVGSLLGLALLCALLALRWQKPLTVLSTAVFGAAVIVVCVDYFVELLALLHHVYDRLRLAPSSPLCWHSWAVLGLWPALSLLGLLLQWKLTAGGYSHADVIISRRQQRLQLLRIRQREAKKRQSLPPQEGSYRRKPNPVKRYAGDVLAPSYIQSLRDRQLGTGTAHTILDLDYDCGSTVPLTAPTPGGRL